MSITKANGWLPLLLHWFRLPLPSLLLSYMISTTPSPVACGQFLTKIITNWKILSTGNTKKKNYCCTFLPSALFGALFPWGFFWGVASFFAISVPLLLRAIHSKRIIYISVITNPLDFEKLWIYSFAWKILTGELILHDFQT